MTDQIRNDADMDESADGGTEDHELQLKRDAELASYMMLDNEGARIANLGDENRRLVAAGLAENLETASREHGLDVKELRHKLELSRQEVREESYEM
jgi:hypothetical protein